MPRFHQVGLSFTAYFILLFALERQMQMDIPFLAWFLPACLLIYISGKGAVNIHSNFFVPAICEGKTTQKEIALTFDDGPDETITPQVLALLKKHQLPATFFLIGRKIKGKESIVQQIDAEGHLIGNHSFSHTVLFDFKFSRWIRKELQQTQGLIEQTIGKKVRYFRPPFGITNPHISIAAKKENYKVIGWNIRPYDAVLNDKDLILKKAKEGLKPGSILLFHDIKPLILEVLNELIPYLKEQGYRVVALDKLIDEEAYF